MRVWTQDPAPNTPVTPGSPVTIRFYGDNPSVATVPDLTGRGARDAEAALAAVGLRGEFRGSGRARRAEESYRVVKQNPKAGSTVKPGSVVKVEYLEEFRGKSGPAGGGGGVQRTPADPLMPVLTGLRRAEVGPLVALSGISIKWREIGPAPSQNDADRIVRQSAAPFTAVPRGVAPVVEFYGPFRGGSGGGGTIPLPPRQQMQTVRVPNVAQMTSAEAANALTRAGLRPGIHYVSGTPSANHGGRVARTDPPAGATVQPGAQVAVAVYEPYRAPVQPPPPVIPPKPPGGIGTSGTSCPPPGAMRCAQMVADGVGSCIARNPNGTLTASCHYNWMLGSQDAHLTLHVNTASPQGGCGAVTRVERAGNSYRFFVNSATRRAYVLVESSGDLPSLLRDAALHMLRQADALTQTPCR